MVQRARHLASKAGTPNAGKQQGGKQAGGVAATHPASASLSQVLSTSNSVLLQQLPSNATSEWINSSLPKMVGDKSIAAPVRLALEPGCALHVGSEAEAAYVAKHITSKNAALKTSFLHTHRPAVLLSQLPVGVDAAAVKEALKQYGAVSVDLSGGNVAFAEFATAEDAQHFCRSLESSSSLLQGRQVMASSSGLVQSSDKHSVRLYNLPSGVSQEDVSSFAASVSSTHAPTSVSLTSSSDASSSSGRKVMFRYDGAVDAAAALSAVQASLPAGATASVEAIPFSTVVLRTSASLSEQEVASAVSSFSPMKVVQQLTLSGKPTAVSVLYFSSAVEANRAALALNGAAIAGHQTQALVKSSPLPAVMVNNLSTGTTAAEVLKACKDVGATEVRLIPTKNDIGEESLSALVMLRSTRDVDFAKNKLHNNKINDKRVKVHRSPVMDQAIVLRGMPSGYATSDAEALAKTLSPSPRSTDAANTGAVAAVVFSTAEQAKRAATAISSGLLSIPGVSSPAAAAVEGQTSSSSSSIRAKLSTYPAVTVEVRGLSDTISVSDLIQDLSSSSSVSASRSAILAYTKASDASAAMKQVRQQGLAGNKVLTQRYFPGQSTSSSASVAGLLGNDETATSPEEDVLFGGSNTEGGDWFSHFDQTHVRQLLTDYMDTDPAVRYEVALNTFRRALQTFKWTDDVSALLDDAQLKAMMAGGDIKNVDEVRSAMKKMSVDALFKQYLNRKDMKRFAGDLDQMSKLFNSTPEEGKSDPFHWSNFSLLSEETVLSLDKKMREIQEKERKQQNVSKAALKSAIADAESSEKDVEVSAGESKKDASSLDVIDLRSIGGIDIDVLLKMDKDKVIGFDGRFLATRPNEGGEGSLNSEATAAAMEGSGGRRRGKQSEDISIELRDTMGRLWSGAIIDTDTTQKIVPGGQIMSHRCLVVIGNGQGAAGYGMGKAKTSPESLTAGFRDALKNVQFIEPHNGSLLAHDVEGIHNNCKVYIRAVPLEHGIVAGPAVKAVLARFGIAAASAKAVGRRNPYSVVRATFDALSKHESLDDIAKKRGKRYLTLEYARQQSM